MRLGLSLLLCLALAGDATPRAARVTASRAASAPVASTIPPFVLFGWVSPPVESTTAARLEELAGCGLDLALPAWQDSGRFVDNVQRFDFAAPVGVSCLTWDRRLEKAVRGKPSADSILNAVVADYAGRAGFFGWYFTDEPQPAEFPLLADFFRRLRASDPAHPSFNNLLGRSAFGTRDEWQAYVRAYADSVEPAVLCDDQYDFLVGGDRGQFVENVAGLNAISRERGVPFWVIVQLVPHGQYRPLEAGELYWQTSMALAYGARGIGYFTYWTPAPDPQWNWQRAVIGYDGERGPWYDVLASWNPKLRAVGETLAGLTWLATVHAGSLPIGGTPFVPDGVLRGVDGRAAMGWFADAAGKRHALVANADALQTRIITLHATPGAALSRFDASNGAWRAESRARSTSAAWEYDLTLLPGQNALVRFEGTEDGEISGGMANRLSLLPNPAGSQVLLNVSGASRRARLEILDAGGRRVWARDVGVGLSSITWKGETDHGGVARAGLYFARFEDLVGVSVRRFAWLGR